MPFHELHLIFLSFDFQGDARVISRRAGFSLVLTPRQPAAPRPGAPATARDPPARARYDFRSFDFQRGPPRVDGAP